MTILYVAIGGAIGSVLRYITVIQAGKLLGMELPYSTLIVNVVGSLLMGMLIGAIARFIPDDKILHPMLAIGFLGGYTTFSAFSLDAITLLERGEILSLVSYVFASVLLALAALSGGLLLMRML